MAKTIEGILTRRRAVFTGIVLFLALATMVLLTTSCALIVTGIIDRPDRLAATQKDLNYRGAECRKVLVIGLIEETSRRVAVENVFTDRLTQQGLQAVVGSLKLPDLASLKDRAFIDQLLLDGHIDHVITVEIKDVADKDLPGWPRNWSAKPLPKGDLTDMAPSPGIEKSIHFEITLWDVKSMKREWAGTTLPLDRYSIMRDLAETADATAFTLKSDKILLLGKNPAL